MAAMQITADSKLGLYEFVAPLGVGGSADGRSVAYVRTNTVRVRQILTDSDVEILPAGRFQRSNSLTVTPDGNYVDAVAVSEARVFRTCGVFRCSVARRSWCLRKVRSAPGWSPDGRPFAFICSGIPSRRASLLVADADGLHVRVLVTRKPPLMFRVTTSEGSRPSAM
jgi:hypothetical protein